jgi:hypothetical protein
MEGIIYFIGCLAIFYILFLVCKFVLRNSQKHSIEKELNSVLSKNKNGIDKSIASIRLISSKLDSVSDMNKFLKLCDIIYLIDDDLLFESKIIKEYFKKEESCVATKPIINIKYTMKDNLKFLEFRARALDALEDIMSQDKEPLENRNKII